MSNENAVSAITGILEIESIDGKEVLTWDDGKVNEYRYLEDRELVITAILKWAEGRSVDEVNYLVSLYQSSLRDEQGSKAPRHSQ